ncbi:MAG: T9SS type A sorting domain-containing protein [Bacteroidales bacterium]|nr:T9SS type A sorting domain-containing protein [Bacteroidales bacterium]
MNKLFLLILSFVTITIFAQEVDTEAPLNPNFIKWRSNLQFKSGESTGDIPIPVIPGQEWILSETSKKASAFDAVYDLRTLGLVTVAKDQGNCGACWTFGTLGSLESTLLKQGFGTYDFSEQSIRTCHGFIMGADMACSGGNSHKSAAYLTRGSGPILENDVPYNTDNYAGCDLTTTPQFRVYDVNFLPNDQNVIKQAIINYGALYTNMSWQSSAYTSSSKTFYYSGTEETNHAVLLVGWDDNKSTAAGKGAWIVKNSWGTDWGENGFFYIAYQDSKTNSSVTSFQGVESRNDGDILHAYDELGWLSSTGYGNDYAKALIKFTTGEKQSLLSVGTYATASGAVIKANIYQTKSGNILSGLLGSTEFVTCTYSGYHRLDLISEIELEANQTFYVEVQYHTPFYTYPIPFEKAIADYAEPSIRSSVGWISSDGTTWNAVGSDILDKERDLSVRVYARSATASIDPLDVNNQTIKVYPQPANNKLSIDFESNYLNQKMRIFDIRGQLLLQQKISQLHETIQLDVFAPGIYLIQIEDQSGSVVALKKFMRIQ